jgi:TPR repeat protein/tetratricopeptide (TPR) repeat protein
MRHLAQPAASEPLPLESRPPSRVRAVFSPAAAIRRAIALTSAGRPQAAFRLYVRAARAGLPEAEYRLGRCYLEGTGVPASRRDALAWLERAGRHGEVEAQTMLAVLHLHGMGGGPDSGEESHAGARLFGAEETAAPDYRAAAHWARLAAEGGSAEGQAVLASILTSGSAEVRDVNEADFWFERSAVAGCPQGMLGHALAIDRKGGPRSEVIELLSNAGRAGLPMALYLLGVISEHALGVARDQAAAAQFYRRAAEHGCRPAQTRWGQVLLGGLGVELDAASGESWLRRAALAGDSEAAFLVGDLYVKGGRLPPNHIEAANWFRRAAEAGHSGAARSLGLLYLSGSGVPADAEEAARWFRRSADAGDRAALAELGNLVLKGVGGDDDGHRVSNWFAQAAASGDPVAAFNYAVCLTHGIGVGRNDREAARWLRKASDNVVDAQYWYGRILLDGRGVERDPQQGHAWLARAAASGAPRTSALPWQQVPAGGAAERGSSIAATAPPVGPSDGGIFAATACGAREGVGACAAAAPSPATPLPLNAGRGVQEGSSAQDEPPRAAPQGELQEGFANAVASGFSKVSHDLTSPSQRIGSSGGLKEEPTTVKPTTLHEQVLCPCGSGLRACRCCDLDPVYAATPVISGQLPPLLKTAAEALARGDGAAAESLCFAALDVAPRLPRALWLLYQIRRSSGPETAAMALLERLVMLDPNNVEAVQELALLQFMRRELAIAEQHARNAIRLAPRHPRSHNLLGMILTEAQNPHTGEFHYRRALEFSGERDPILLANLAWNLKSQGKIAESRALYEESIAAAPEVFQTLFGRAQLEESDRNHAGAQQWLDRAAALRPDDSGVHIARARLLINMGSHDAALAALERSDDASGARSDPDWLLQKGRILDRLARHDEAFACFEAAKRRLREVTGKAYLEREAQESAARLSHFFVGDRLRLLPRAPARKDCAQPIFILGFPRSGTTLVEQSLSSHPRISAGDELPFINELSGAIPRLFASPLGYPEALAELWMGDNCRGLETLRDSYLQKAELRGIVNPGSAWFTDKMPLNEMHLGLIALIFPHAPLIHILRHPLDVVLSVFSHYLTHGYFCANALESIARHYVLVMDLVQRYRAEMTLRYLPVRYEDLVDDMAGGVRRMLDFIGEPFDERCVNFQDNRRLPLTPSYAQVAERLYDRSRFRYRHYRRHLEPVIPILRPIIDRLGYTVDVGEDRATEDDGAARRSGQAR